MEAIVLDTETTGFDEPEVIELAWHSLISRTGECRRFKPTKPITFGAMATHHILMSDLEGLPQFEPAHVPSLDYLIGHKVDFDWENIGKPQCKRICTLAMARHLWPETQHSLGALMYFLFGATEDTRTALRNAHSAEHDVAFTTQLLQAICSIAKIPPDDFEALYRFSEDARVPRFWTFGKFIGEPIGKADRGYANWYRKCTSPPPDPYVLEALRRAGSL